VGVHEPFQILDRDPEFTPEPHGPQFALMNLTPDGGLADLQEFRNLMRGHEWFTQHHSLPLSAKKLRSA
jgi:hypothetical protein